MHLTYDFCSSEQKSGLLNVGWTVYKSGGESLSVLSLSNKLFVTSYYYQLSWEKLHVVCCSINSTEKSES